ncbi:hypothetical protein OIV83_005244 [Microbotryomycetes sp. JL201]|nr:hypothetical protein OIV83_005244 [Microbotryomycetes sp. JL201]
MEPLPLESVAAERVHSRLSAVSQQRVDDDHQSEKDKTCIAPDGQLRRESDFALDKADDRMDAAKKFVDDDFVEGGLRGWLNVAGSFMLLFATFGYVNAFGVYQSYYQLNFLSDKSASDIAWIGSTGLAIEYSMAFVAGPIFDRGYFRALIMVGAIGFVFCLFMVSLCREYWQIMLAQGIALGLSMGCIYMPSVSVLNHYFFRKRGLVMGIAMAGSSLGGIVFPIMLNRLFSSGSFGNAVRASAYLIAGLFLAANLIMKARYPKTSESASALNRSEWTNMKVILKEARYQMTVVAITLIVLGTYYPVTYLQVFAELSGMPKKISDNILAILNTSSFMGRILLPAAADRFGPFNMLVLSAGGASIMILSLYGVNSPASVIVFSLIYGFFAGGIVSLISPALISTARHVSEIGMRQGCAFILNGLAALVCAPIAGALLEAGGGKDFKWCNAFAGGVMGLGAITLFVSRCAQAKLLGKNRV